MYRLRVARNIKLGTKNLLLHKLRSLLTVLGVVCGVGSVITMLSVGEGASRQALDQIRKLGSNNIILESIKPTEDEQAATRRVFMSVYGLLYDDELRIRETMPEVSRTVPTKEVRKVARLGERSLELRVVGTTPGWFDLVQRRILAGRTIGLRDFEQFARVCVLTEYGARRLLATHAAIGQPVRIGGDYFEIIGIVQSEQAGGAIHTPDQQIDAYIPLNVTRESYGDIMTRMTAGSRQRELVELHGILVEVSDSVYVESVAKAIEAMLKRFHKREDYRISVPLTLLRQTEATKRTFNIVLGTIAGISLLVGGIGIMNIMLASVTERTREIGIRRAIGAKRRQIIAQFLAETVVLSSIGGSIGILAGLLLSWGITLFSGVTTILPGYSIPLSLGISVSVGLIFGIYPAARAAKLDPIVALRHE